MPADYLAALSVEAFGRALADVAGRRGGRHACRRTFVRTGGRRGGRLRTAGPSRDDPPGCRRTSSGCSTCWPSTTAAAWPQRAVRGHVRRGRHRRATPVSLWVLRGNERAMAFYRRLRLRAATARRRRTRRPASWRSAGSGRDGRDGCAVHSLTMRSRCRHEAPRVAGHLSDPSGRLCRRDGTGRGSTALPARSGRAGRRAVRRAGADGGARRRLRARGRGVRAADHPAVRPAERSRGRGHRDVRQAAQRRTSCAPRSNPRSSGRHLAAADQPAPPRPGWSSAARPTLVPVMTASDVCAHLLMSAGHVRPGCRPGGGLAGPGRAAGAEGRQPAAAGGLLRRAGQGVRRRCCDRAWSASTRRREDPAPTSSAARWPRRSPARPTCSGRATPCSSAGRPCAPAPGAPSRPRSTSRWTSPGIGRARTRAAAARDLAALQAKASAALGEHPDPAAAAARQGRRPGPGRRPRAAAAAGPAGGAARPGGARLRGGGDHRAAPTGGRPGPAARPAAQPRRRPAGARPRRGRRGRLRARRRRRLAAGPGRRPGTGWRPGVRVVPGWPEAARRAGLDRGRPWWRSCVDRRPDRARAAGHPAALGAAAQLGAAGRHRGRRRGRAVRRRPGHPARRRRAVADRADRARAARPGRRAAAVPGRWCRSPAGSAAPAARADT